MAGFCGTSLQSLSTCPYGICSTRPTSRSTPRACKRAEGDDLRDLIAAVALLHVSDDFVAAVLAEVDVEVGHRHAFRIEKALEQQAEAHRIEVGDGERIGNQRARAGAAARTDRNALRFCPLNEVGDDQEVARIFHPFDDAELEVEPLVVIVGREAFGEPGGLQAPREPFFRAFAQKRRFVLAGRETGQDGLRRPRPEGAALRDLNRVFERLRQIGKQSRHLFAGFEAMFGRELTPLGVGDQFAFRDGDQRVVRFVVGGGREIRLVGRDQWQAVPIGEIDQRRLDAALRGKPWRCSST